MYTNFSLTFVTQLRDLHLRVLIAIDLYSAQIPIPVRPAIPGIPRTLHAQLTAFGTGV